VNSARIALLTAACALLLSAAPARAGAAPPDSLKWLRYDEAVRLAEKTDRHILVQVSASWCRWCRRMAAITYRDTAVVAELNRHFVLARVDAESALPVTYQGKPMTEAGLARLVFEALQYPTIVFLARDEKVVVSETGYMGPPEFLSMARYVGDGSYEEKLRSLPQHP
jgi:thioredoxin-related protein